VVFQVRTICLRKSYRLLWDAYLVDVDFHGSALTACPPPNNVSAPLRAERCLGAPR
jgi:hypothetical protein